MKFSHFNRRLHLYLGLFLLPWFAVYGVSSIPFSHPQWFRSDNDALWKLRLERPYELPVQSDDLKEIGSALVKEIEAKGAYGANRPNPNRINVYVHTFWTATRITYDIPAKQLRAEDRQFRWRNWLTGFHARGGFQHDSLLNDAWALVVDAVCVAFLVWIATGLYMWWQLPQSRWWGWTALGAGVASFIGFLLAL
jgi:hypothetical protein